jgi:outer membrane lipoprotein-sorting protein
LFLRILITYFFFFNFFLTANANEKELIINRLSEIKNFSFNFKQISENKTETGNCLLEFDRKLKCYYNNKLKKEIIINNKTLVVRQKRYNKIYFYPISKSPFLNILTKNKLITLIQKSDLVVNENIKLIYLDENKKKITVLFEKKNYELTGWLMEDEFQNKINFSLRIENINNKISKNYFKVPSPN